MLEGLHSTDPAVLAVTESWVKTAMSGGSSDDSLTRLLQPALKILLEPSALRKPAHEKLGVSVTLSREDAEKDMEYARYYFQSLGIENPYVPSKKEQYSESVLFYSQLVDSSQLLYATSLLQSVVAVEPEMFVFTAGNVMVDVSSLTGPGGTSEAAPAHLQGIAGREHSTKNWENSAPTRRKPPCDSTTPLSPSPAMNKSLLELLLSVCVDMLRSEYHSTLKISASDQLENLNVKVASASLLSTILLELLKVLAGKKREVQGGASGETGGGVVGEWKVWSPSFVSALIALCDIQQVVLLLLGKSLQWWGEAFCASRTGCECSSGGRGGGGGSSKPWTSVTAAELDVSMVSSTRAQDNLLGVVLRSLYRQLLRAVQCLMVLDSQLCLTMEGGETRLHQQASSSSSSSSSKPDLVTVSSGITLPNTSHDSSKRPRFLPAIVPSILTASQPYFKAFLLVILNSSSLSSFHNDLLHMLSATLSNLLHHQVLELAPVLFKQLCTNIERSISLPTQHSGSDFIGIREGGRSLPHNDHLCVIYMKTLLSIVCWSLFGMKTEEKSAFHPSSCRSGKPGFMLHSRLRNPQYDIFQVVQTRSIRENLSPTLKQPSAMSWLLGVFSTSSSSQKPPPLPGLSGSGSGGVGVGTGEGGGVSSDGTSVEGTSHLSHGVDSLVGQHVLMLLPAVYNAMAAVWTHLGLGVGVGKRGGVEGHGEGKWRSSSSHKEGLLVEVSCVVGVAE